jgi:Protein of unknown function (DUF1592)/Protein of unknown function (DUF1588)/Protein of unknown function (DUF1585)/Protein of unknown function (DUF1595)/Protein of unknown function (DUF1587)
MRTGSWAIWLVFGVVVPACGRGQQAGGRPTGAAGSMAEKADGGSLAGAGGAGQSDGGPLAGADGAGQGGAGGIGAAGAGGAGRGDAGETGAAGAGGGVVTANDAGLRPLRLMTEREYRNTVRDLLGDGTFQNLPLPADAQDLTSGFAFHTTGIVTQPIALQYQATAEFVAKAALPSINNWLPCAATAGSSPDAETACLQTFFGPGGFASRLYRRPLTTTPTTGEVDRLTALYQAARSAEPASPDISGSVDLVIQAMLQTPEFLYHWEIDSGPATREGTLVKLGNYEIANRLSYLLWGSMPDATLLASAAAGELGDLGGVETQVRRMLKDPKAADTFADFFTDWLDLDIPPAEPKDPAVYPQYSEALAEAMTEEVGSFVNAILIDGSGRLDDILTGTSSFANEDLATLYGIAGVAGSALAMVALDPAQRSGLFTTAAFLSSTGDPGGSNPPRRGNALYQKLLCELLPEAIPAMPAVDAPTTGGGTTRQRFDEYGTMACATACHAQIDPLGFAFENYDGIGAFRTTDSGAPVDASVTVTLDGQPQMVANARGLLAVMATSDQVQTCFARQWLRYGLGRMDNSQDASSLDAAAGAFKNSMRDIRELIVAIATSPTFRYRTPGTGEMLQ